MSENIVITSALLAEWGASADGIRAFNSVFKNDTASVEEVLSACAERKRAAYEGWFLGALTSRNIALPAALASVGGDLYLRGYQHPLPAGLVQSNKQAAAHNKRLCEEA